MAYFTQHLEEVNESYFQHMRHAARFSMKLAVGSMACLVHSIFPFLCEKTGSAIIAEMHHDMVLHRIRLDSHKELDGPLADTV